MAIWQTAGKVRMTPKGVYSSSTAYEILDIVSNADQAISYIAKQAVPAGTALTNTTYWAVIADVTEALENADAAISYIGDSYSSSSTYAVGDYVIHDGGLYRCKTAISTAEAWTAAHWEQVSAMDEIQDVKDEVTDLKSAIITIKSSTNWEDGSFSPVSGAPYATTGAFSRCMDALSYSAGTISVSSSATMRLFAYTSSGVYVGILKSDGTFAKETAGEANLKSFNLSGYKDYIFRVVLKSSSESDRSGTLFTVYALAQNLDTLSNTVDALSGTVDALSGDVDTIMASNSTMTTIYVSPNGNDSTGDGSLDNPFASIYHANESITDNSALKQYTIKVADGVYTDLQTRFAGTTPSSVNLQGIRCKPYVFYEGNPDDPAACKIVWDGAYGYDKSTYRYDNCGFYKCIFHVESGTTAIRGFTIEASNTRYALHIECGGYGLGFNWEISDCIFLWHGTPDCVDRASTGSTSTIGTGSGNYEKGHLLRCKIVNDAGITRGWMNHDSQNRYPDKAVYEGAEIVLESCVFNGNIDQPASVVWRNTHDDNVIDGYDRFSIINCIGINSLTYMLSGDATVCKWRAMIKCSDIANNDFATQGLLQ